ncbi:MAG: YdjY domain-containing protein [Pirellulales bacterium]
MESRGFLARRVVLAALLVAAAAASAFAQSDDLKKVSLPKLPEPEGATRLAPKYDVWLDAKRGAVLVDGQVSLRRGMLEMFACIRNTKEHESVVTVDTQAFLVHAGLLRLGAEPGHPAQFVPEFKPPAGTEIEITVEWRDEQGKEHTARAQDWIRDIKTGKAMTYPFVFAGSRFWTDEETGKQYYQAEGGDFICVSNFGTAAFDIPVESSQSNDALEFEAFTERIPPLGTPVRLVMKPVLKKAGSKEQGAGSKEAK